MKFFVTALGSQKRSPIGDLFCVPLHPHHHFSHTTTSATPTTADTPAPPRPPTPPPRQPATERPRHRGLQLFARLSRGVRQHGAVRWPDSARRPPWVLWRGGSRAAVRPASPSLAPPRGLLRHRSSVELLAPAPARSCGAAATERRGSARRPLWVLWRGGSRAAALHVMPLAIDYPPLLRINNIDV